MGRHQGARGRRPPGPKKSPLTHFLCLPIINAESKGQVQVSLERFRSYFVSVNEVVESTGTNSAEGVLDAVKTRIPLKAIRPVGALHCTLGVMSLDSKMLDEAVTFLQTLDLNQLLLQALQTPESGHPNKQPQGGTETEAKSAEWRSLSPLSDRRPGSLQIDLKGLEPMHDSQKTSILYVTPKDKTNRLLPFCEALQTAFRDKGFLVKDDRKLKLHATIVNTIYAKGRRPPRPRTAPPGSAPPAAEDRSLGHGPSADAPLKIDARSLLERCEDFVWAENVTLDRVTICEMGAKKKLDGEGNVVDEEYTEVVSVAMPY